MNECHCGCGQPVTAGATWVRGHDSTMADWMMGELFGEPRRSRFVDAFPNLAARFRQEGGAPTHGSQLS